MKRIYLDYAAATPVDEKVKEAMEPFWSKEFANPSSIHQEGKKAKEVLESSRKAIASLIGAKPGEIIFTSGATEANNLAIFGSARGDVITTTIEHPSILEPIKKLEKEGREVTYLKVGEDGIISPEDVRRALRQETVLVSFGYASSEIGTIQPIAEIGKMLKNHNCLFHTDASQAAGFLNLNPQYLGVDLMSVNGAKIYGPKGIGFLYKRRGVELSPLISGGGQEEGVRAGTENIPLIAGLAKAFELSEKNKKEESRRLSDLRDYFIASLSEKIPGVKLEGHPARRLPNNVNISVAGLDPEALVISLDQKGIAASTGFACASSHLYKSHQNSLRISLGRDTKKEDLDFTIKVLKEIVAKNKKSI